MRVVVTDRLFNSPDLPAGDCDISPVVKVLTRIDHGAAFDDEVVGHVWLSVADSVASALVQSAKSRNTLPGVSFKIAPSLIAGTPFTST